MIFMGTCKGKKKKQIPTRLAGAQQGVRNEVSPIQTIQLAVSFKVHSISNSLPIAPRKDGPPILFHRDEPNRSPAPRGSSGSPCPPPAPRTTERNPPRENARVRHRSVHRLLAAPLKAFILVV